MTARPAAHRDDAGDHLRLMIAELTRPHRHRERYTAEHGQTTWSRFHHTRVPPLLVQLGSPDPVSGDTSRSGGFESRPALSIDAYDTLVRIDLAAARWVRDLGEDDPDTTVACVQLLAGLAASAHRCTRRTAVRDKATRKVTCCTWHRLDDDVRAWWQQARVITGWDSPAWRPDATCPACGVRGSLRIRLEDRTGVCVECREVFGPAVQAPLEKGLLKVAAGLPLADRLERELKQFRVKISAKGSDTFGALRESDHDDLVVALALALRGWHPGVPREEVATSLDLWRSGPDVG